MAIEIKTRNLEEIRALANEYLKKSDECEDVKEKAIIEEDLNTIVKDYAAESKAQTYAKINKAENPMHAAIITFFYPVIKVAEKKDGETGVITRSIEDAQKPIELGDLHKKLKDLNSEGIGADKNWIYQVEKFNFHLTKRAADRVGAKVNTDAFVMHDIAKQIELGKNPCSNNQLLKTLQSIVTAMLGEGYKATSHDVNYLVDCYANDNRKSKTSIAAANHKTLRNYLKKVCYRILTNGKGYGVEQKEIKGK